LRLAVFWSDDDDSNDDEVSDVDDSDVDDEDSDGDGLAPSTELSDDD